MSELKSDSAIRNHHYFDLIKDESKVSRVWVDERVVEVRFKSGVNVILDNFREPIESHYSHIRVFKGTESRNFQIDTFHEVYRTSRGKQSMSASKYRGELPSSMECEWIPSRGGVESFLSRVFDEAAKGNVIKE